MGRGRVFQICLASGVVAAAVLALGPSTGVSDAGAEIAAQASTATATLAPPPTFPDRNVVPDGGRAYRGLDEVLTPWDLPNGSLVWNPVSAREEIIDLDIARQVVLFGDSQSSGMGGVKSADTWVEKALSSRGYHVRFVGAPGTGFVAKTTQSTNYPDAISTGRVVLPYGSPALLVLQGGGNDAAQGATDAQITANVERLLRELRASYPSCTILMIGTLGRGLPAKSDRRVQVDAVLAKIAMSNGVSFISPRDWITKYKVGNKMLDGVHLSTSGHQVLSTVLAGELTKLGLQAPVR